MGRRRITCMLRVAAAWKRGDGTWDEKLMSLPSKQKIGMAASPRWARFYYRDISAVWDGHALLADKPDEAPGKVVEQVADNKCRH